MMDTFKMKDKEMEKMHKETMKGITCDYCERGKVKSTTETKSGNGKVYASLPVKETMMPMAKM